MMNKTRTQNQDDWKRSQIRIPQEQYDEVAEFAKEHDLSLNSAMIDLLDRGLSTLYSVNPSSVKIINLDNGIKRIIHGKMINSFDIDFTQDLDSLKSDIKMYLEYMSESRSLKERFMFFNKKVCVYKGGSHLDIVDDGVGSLNWLIVEDHITDKHMEYLASDK